MSAYSLAKAYRCMSHKSGPSIDARATFLSALSMYEPHFLIPLSMYEPHFPISQPTDIPSSRATPTANYRCLSHILHAEAIDVPAIFSSTISMNGPQFLDVRTTENLPVVDARATKTRLMSHKFISNVLKSKTIRRPKQVTLCLDKTNKTIAVLLLKEVN